MKKLPMLTQLKARHGRTLALVFLVALLVTVGYFRAPDARPTGASLPIERVPLHTPSPTPQPAAARTPAPAQAVSSFDAYRRELDSAREEAAALLDEVIETPGASAQTVQQALADKAELARTREIETAIETLLAARGFPEALCTVRRGSVNVVVHAQSLTQQQAAQILDVAVSESGESASNVRIVPAQ